MLKSALGAALAITLAITPAREAPGRHAATRAAPWRAADVLARSRAAYAALQSYADEGTVADENTGFTDRYTFRTFFTRDPRNFLLDFRYAGSDYTNGLRLKGGDQIVLWMLKGDLQTWNSKAQEHETVPPDGGRQVDALKGASYGTRNISVLVPSLLYTKAGIASVVQATEEAVADGEETVGGRRCVKVMGVERWRYPSGQVTGVRPITLWIDAETYLIRKVLEDTPKNYPHGSISRRVVTLAPVANPRLDDTKFRFVVPDQQR